MEIRLLRQATDLILRRPYVLFLVLLSVVGDLWVVFSFDYSATHSGMLIVGLPLISLLAEAGLVYAFSEQIRGKANNLVDSFMTAVTAPGKVFGAKLLPLIAPLVYFVLALVLSVTVANDRTMGLILGLIALPPLLFCQVMAFFTLCGTLIQEYSFGEAFSHAGRILWEHRGRMARLFLLLLAVQVVLIGVLVAFQAVSGDSALVYRVTPEMAELNILAMRTQYTEPGDYFSLSRPVNGLIASLIKGRGLDLLTMPLYFTDNTVVGAAVVLLNGLLLPLQLAMMVGVYFQIAEPTPELSDLLQNMRQSRTAVQGGGSEGAFPAAPDDVPRGAA